VVAQGLAGSLSFDMSQEELQASAQEAIQGLHWSIAARDWSRGVKYYCRVVADIHALKHHFTTKAPLPSSSISGLFYFAYYLRSYWLRSLMTNFSLDLDDFVVTA